MEDTGSTASWRNHMIDAASVWLKIRMISDSKFQLSENFRFLFLVMRNHWDCSNSGFDVSSLQLVAFPTSSVRPAQLLVILLWNCYSYAGCTNIKDLENTFKINLLFPFLEIHSRFLVCFLLGFIDNADVSSGQLSGRKSTTSVLFGCFMHISRATIACFV